MIVSFNFSLYPREELRRLPVHLLPIIDGLVEAGHRVERFAVGLKPAPVINVLPYHPASGTAVDQLIEAWANADGALCGGLLCLDPVGDAVHDETSDPALVRLVKTVDFVWSIPPLGDIPCARIRYGHLSRGPRPQMDVARDIDVTLRGGVTARRKVIFDQLSQRGASCFWIDNLNLPPYVTDDILSRSKIVLDLRPEEGRMGGSPAFTAQALHHATAIVSELGGPDDFAGFTIPTPAEQIVERCIQILNSGMHAGLGAAALQKFQAETSMRENMAEVLRHPAVRKALARVGAV